MGWGVSGGVPRLVSNSGIRLVFDSSVGADHPEPRSVVFEFELEVLAWFLRSSDEFVAKFVEAWVPLVKVNESALELASSLFIGLLENVDVIDNPKWSAIDSVKDIANALLIDVVEHPGNAKAGLVGCASESVGSAGSEFVDRH
jgi:hypothetical protein